MNVVMIPIIGAVSLILVYIFITVFIPFASLLNGYGLVSTLMWMMPIVVIGGVFYSMYQKTQEERV